MAYQNHSKFTYKNHDEIQQCINSGELNAWDLVLCKDTKEFILIKDDLSLHSVKSKVYRFLDVESAENALNESEDTYAGQLVSIVNKRGTYEAYVVNQRANGSFKVDPVSVYAGSVDYDDLGHRPIENLYGEIGSPIILDKQKDGIYKVTGQYKVSDVLDTVFFGSSSNLFLVQHDEEVTYVKKISTDEIIDYTVNNDSVTSSAVPTTEWLESQGYVTESYIDAKIAALDFITQEEIEEYVSDIVLQNIDALVNERITQELDNRVQYATMQEHFKAYAQIFK